MCIRDSYEAVKRGDLSQMSFAFDIGRQTFDERARERTITQVARVYEISIVNRAAYPQTHVTARNAQEEEKAMFNPIESAVLNAANVNPDTHATPEYRAAFFKKLLGKELTEAETRAFEAAQAERRADSFNTLSNSAAAVSYTHLDVYKRQAEIFGDLQQLFAIGQAFPNGI